jgi:hypothetical protein
VRIESSVHEYYKAKQPQMAFERAPRFLDSAYQSAIASLPRPSARICQAARREFILTKSGLITVRQVLERAYIRRRPKRFTHWHRLAVRRALRRIGAIAVARKRFGRGRPALWALSAYA